MKNFSLSGFYGILGNRIRPRYGLEKISEDGNTVESFPEIRLLEPLVKFAELSDRYLWRHIIKDERAARASIYGMVGLQAVAVLGVEYGLGIIAGEPDMLYNGLYAHLALDMVMVTLAPSWGRYRALSRR